MADDAVQGSDEHEVTRLLHELQAGDGAAADRVLPLIYQTLHEIARRQMRGERPDHTLQPTALVHDAFLKLVGQQASWQNREQFYRLAARVMRRLLVDHARRRHTRKRDRTQAEQFAAAIEPPPEPPALDLVLLDEALGRLAELDERVARVVELRYFVGLSVPEVAELLGISAATVKRDWQFASAWLRRELSDAR